jgi:hypothetical protein
MHNSLRGAAIVTVLPQYQAGPFLLQGIDVSTACFNCHEGTGGNEQVSTSGVDSTLTVLPNNFDKAGGDFSWIKTTTGDNSMNRGHSVVSVSYGYTADTVRTVAPGGTYLAEDLGCTGCHDPHGRFRRLNDGTITLGGAPIQGSGSHGEVPNAGLAVGAYRLLGGSGYTPRSSTVAVTFGNNPPAAAALNFGNNDMVAYGSDMSEWCSNCHLGIFEDGFISGEAGHRHPAANSEKLTAELVNNYNNYVGTGIVGGSPATARYNRLVPFEEGNADWAALGVHAANTVNTPADASSNVMCLSCHRVHASGFGSLGRFDFGSELVTDATGGWEPVDGVSNITYIMRAYNNNTFGSAQRTLCNKCHAQD